MLGRRLVFLITKMAAISHIEFFTFDRIALKSCVIPHVCLS